MMRAKHIHQTVARYMMALRPAPLSMRRALRSLQSKRGPTPSDETLWDGMKMQKPLQSGWSILDICALVWDPPPHPDGVFCVSTHGGNPAGPGPRTG